MECDVNDPDAEVTWFHLGEKVKIDGKMIVAEKKNRKRRLVW